MTDLVGPRTGGKRQAAARMADVMPQCRADVTGVICSAQAMSLAGAPACRYTISDGTGELDLLFLGRTEIAGMWCGRRCRAIGTVGKRDDRLVLWNPRYWLAATDSEPQDAPVVAVSAQEAVATRTALAAGATGYLSKPFAMDTLLARTR